MRHIILISLEMLICYLAIILLNKKYKTDGLYVYGIVATFMSCIMSLKQIDIFGVPVPIGFGVTTSLLIAGNIITQKKGPGYLKTYLILIIVTALISCCFLNISGIMEDSPYNKFANKSYDSIFKYNLRIYFANIISILISIFLGSKLYYLIKRLNNQIILSNIFSVVIIEFLDTIIFMLIAYLFEKDFMTLILAIIFRYLIKMIIGIFGTIPIYITNRN